MDAIAAAVTSISAPGLNPGAPGHPPTQSVAQSFQQAIAQAQARYVPPGTEGIQTLLSPLLSLNERSADLATQATPAGDASLKPGELMQLTMRSHEFLFHCELVSNVANRTSDGVQQLFRQQS